MGLIKTVQVRMRRRMGMKVRKRVRRGLIKTEMRMRKVGVMRKMREDRVN